MSNPETIPNIQFNGCPVAVGDPDFHNWGKLAGNIRPQTILTTEAT
jgi:hypothetical protein